MATVGMWWGKWCGYMPFDESSISSVPAEPGIYLVAAFRSEDATTPIAIPRCLREDKFGVLCIGKTVNLRRRINSLQGSLDVKSRAHSAGCRYNFVDQLQRQWRESRKLRTQYPREGLKFAYIDSCSAWGAAEDESGALRHYLLKYGELPPLNNHFNWAKWNLRAGESISVVA